MSEELVLDVPPAVLAALGGRPPTREQWEAISMPQEPFVIIAGAGSGKTTVMAARVVYLALVALNKIDGVDPSQGALPGSVLCLTFTVKATENLAARVRTALAGLSLPIGEEPVVTNYHSYAAELLRRSGLLVGVEPQMKLLNSAQRNEVAQRVLDRMDFFVADATKQTLPGNILKLADQMSNHLVTPDEQIRFARTRLDDLERTGAGSKSMIHALEERIELAEGVRIYEQIKHELGAIDFGDQIRAAVELVSTHPQVAAGERARFDAVLLDEYQDTNHAQAVLLQAIFGDGYPVTAVGDPDQNIYAWRGASLHNLMHFPETFPRADGAASRRLPLYTNFRSGADILSAADTIVDALPSEQRPDEDKVLRPWPDNGQGEVQVRRFRDEWQEVAWIADRVKSLQADGHPLAEIAVLSRKSRLFASLQEAFIARDIPTEIIGLAGLLQMPEVQEVLSYARATIDATASVAIGRILMGPRYRLGYKDIAKMAQWSSEQNRESRDRFDEEEQLTIMLAEALARLDEIPDLSDDARERLTRFDAELRALQIEARRPVGEFLAEIIRRIGLIDELDASLHRQTAAATKRNLAAFLDQVDELVPLEGELTLTSFLDHVSAAEGEERQEWSPAQPSDAKSVKIMTVHQAKGLEFDTVFVPGLAQGLLPDTTIQQNPSDRAYSMDFELRGDVGSLPTLPGLNWNASNFRKALQEQELFEERRTCYVALTRARKSLFVTGAWLYGVLSTQPKKPSELLENLVTWAEDHPDTVVELNEGPGDDEDPLAEFRERLVRPWPGPAKSPDADDALPGGWREAALTAAAEGGVEQTTLLNALTADERTRFDAGADAIRAAAGALLDRVEQPGGAPATPLRLSPSSLITYDSCPKRFYWQRVRPLPTSGSAAARLGTRVHAWIEQRSIAQGTLLDDAVPDALPDATLAEQATGDKGGAPSFADLQQHFLSTRFADAQPLFIERGFILTVDDFTIHGRIDAIYGTPDGAWEIVDYKTGGEYNRDDPAAWLQLDIYALAAVDVWHKDPDELTMTYLFLKGPSEWSRGVEDIEAIRERVRASISGIAAARYEPEPGPACRHCDFRSFCEPGQAWMNREGSPAVSPAVSRED